MTSFLLLFENISSLVNSTFRHGKRLYSMEGSKKFWLILLPVPIFIALILGHSFKNIVLLTSCSLDMIHLRVGPGNWRLSMDRDVNQKLTNPSLHLAHVIYEFVINGVHNKKSSFQNIFILHSFVPNIRRDRRPFKHNVIYINAQFGSVTGSIQ